ncbi:hypothetical protein [Pseudomonas sp. HY13-MNA-CIBAN-0226]|uniref:hypothetical protein n=1 Tax=Pseudomonas sp. HY13-MNA-CIBAN-0226 TaxID=3140473 RepID=UPI00332F0ED7
MSSKRKSPGDLGLFFACLYPSALSPAPNGNQQEGRVLTNTRNPIEVIAMHPAIQQRVDGVAALHLRSSIATAAFYAMIGQELPVQKIRYQVVTKGNGYRIVELATDKVVGFRWTWKTAVNFAQQMEARADGIKLSLAGERK